MNDSSFRVTETDYITPYFLILLDFGTEIISWKTGKKLLYLGVDVRNKPS